MTDSIENIGLMIRNERLRKGLTQEELGKRIGVGKAQISGNMDYEEADNIASTIRIGGLKLELEELRSNVVGAQLGEQAVATSLKAGAIGLAFDAVLFIWLFAK